MVRLDNKKLPRIRWVTWWPVPYWTERFNALSDNINIEMEVIFLSSKSALLPTTAQSELWRFKYNVIRKEIADSGYYHVKQRAPKPWNIVKGNIDLLIMPYGDPDCVTAALICNILNKKYCVFVPNNEFDTRPATIFREKLKQYIFRHAVAALATGPSQAKYASNYIHNKKTIYQIGNPAPHLLGLDNIGNLKDRSRIRKELGWDNKFIALFVGRLSLEKGLYTLLNALNNKLLKCANIKCILIGTGPAEHDLKVKVASSELDVEFAGFIEGFELTKRYIAADVFVLPSSSEPWGLVVNEAMEAGLPVIISDKVGSKNILVRNNENGYIFPSGDAKELSNSILKLINNEKRRAVMSKNSQEIIKAHTVNKWANNVSAVFDELIG